MSRPEPMLLNLTMDRGRFNAAVSGPVNSNGIPQFNHLASMVTELCTRGAIVQIDLTAADGLFDSGMPGLVAVAAAAQAIGATLRLRTDEQAHDMLERYGLGSAIYHGP